MDKIKNMSDLLENILAKDLHTAAEYHKTGGTKHPGLLGDIYEGVTHKLLEETLFEHLNLKVVTGQIKMHNDQLSKQIDCMIVKNTLREIPFTGKYECFIDDVIAIIEVKKTLNKTKLEEALINMQTISKGFDAEKTTVKIREEEIYRAYELLTGNALDDINKYTGDNINKNDYTSVLTNTLILDYCLPLRIIFGYDGYANEITLRKGYLDLIDKHPSIESGPLAIPNLIICKNSSLIKTNGIPYALRIGKPNNSFIGLASYCKTPVLVLLEILWTKLCNIYVDELDNSIFGETTKYENILPLLSYKFENHNGNYGFIGHCCELKKIERSSDRIESKNEAEIINLNAVSFTVLQMLSFGSKVSLRSVKLREQCEIEGITLIELKKELLDTGFIKFNSHNILLRDRGEFLLRIDDKGYHLIIVPNFNSLTF